MHEILSERRNFASFPDGRGAYSPGLQSLRFYINLPILLALISAGSVGYNGRHSAAADFPVFNARSVFRVHCSTTKRFGQIERPDYFQEHFYDGRNTERPLCSPARFRKCTASECNRSCCWVRLYEYGVPIMDLFGTPVSFRLPTVRISIADAGDLKCAGDSI